MSDDKKPKQYGKSEYKVARIIVSCCFIGLMICYGLTILIGSDPFSFMPAIIMILAGILVFVFAIIIWKQKNKVELEYDDVVVYKLCGVAGVLLFIFGIVCLIISIKGLI